jgi:hypothetical protein
VEQNLAGGEGDLAAVAGEKLQGLRGEKPEEVRLLKAGQPLWNLHLEKA